MNSMFVQESQELTLEDTDLEVQANQIWEICWLSAMEPGWREAGRIWIQDVTHTRASPALSEGTVLICT